MVRDETLLEKLAELEHKQWVAWATSILDTEQISEERANRWAKYFVPYDELSEEVKEYDRIWAREVLDILNGRGK